MAFLDKTGLSKLWAKIKATFAKKEQAVYYIEGTGTTAGTWLGSHDDITAYYKGLTVAYKLNVAGASTTTLNINGLGAKTVYINAGKMTTHVPVGSIVVLVYDGTYWRWSNYDSTNTYQLRKYYGSHLASTAIYRYQILLTQKDNKLLPINTTSNSTATTKTLTTASFDPFGAIYFYNTTGTVSAGAAPTTSYLYKQVLADLRYSFNTGTTLTANKPVYMVCELQSDGLFKLASTPITQALPTSADTKYYLYLGQAHDTYRIELSLEHPIYYYDGTKISTYTGINDGDYVKSSLVDNSTTWTQATQNNIPTKFSVANLLTSYAAKTHTHKVADISDFPTSLPASDVSAWAKAASKPTYTASEVGAAASDHTHGEYAKKENSVYFVDGSSSTTAGTWIGTNEDITEYYDGLVVNYKIGVAGASTTKLNINGLGAKTCYLRGTTKLTTHYDVGTMVMLSYNATKDAFYSADYDANSYAYVRQYTTTTDAAYPILFAYETALPSSYDTKYTRKSSGLTYNPSTDTLTVGNINAGNLDIDNLAKLSDIPTSLPASDVSAWAKAASKPSYAWSEITSKPTWIGSSKPTYTASEVSAISSDLYDNSDTWTSATSDNVPTKRSVAAFLSSGYATKTHTHSNYLPTSGGTLTGNVILENDGIGFKCGQENNGFWNYDGYPSIASDDFSIFVSSEINSSNGFWIYFPQKPCNLAAEDDIPHQHDVYILPGSGTAAGVYMYLTLNVKKSTTYSSAAEIAAELYNNGNVSQYYAVSATGRCGSSSSNFIGIIVGVYATSETNLTIMAINPSNGAISLNSYTTSQFTSMRDIVR